MPVGYELQSASIALAPYTTSGTTNTELDFAFIKPGAGAKVSINGLRLQGRGSGLTSLNGMAVNIKNWTTASTTGAGGTSMTPSPVSISTAKAASATASAGTGGGIAVVAAGSGGGTYKGGFGCSASGPSAWTAVTPDQAVEMAAGYAGSCDFYSVATPLSINFDWWIDFLE